MKYQKKSTLRNCSFPHESTINMIGGARGVIVIVVGNEHGDTSSNPGRDLLHFHIALIPLGKVWIQLLSLQLSVSSRVD